MMDKRFFLALLLTALVVAITPVIFPTPRGVGPAAADSARRAAGVAGTASTAGVTADSAAAARGASPYVQGPVAQQPGTPPTVGPALGAAASVAAAAGDSLAGAVGAVRPETTVVATPKVVYGFANVGAAPVSAVMTGYRSLVPGASADRRVELARRGVPLVRYQLVVPGDTIDLSRVPFTARRASASPLAPVTFEAETPAGRVTITYSFRPDTIKANAYMLDVNGRVDGVGSRGALLVELPGGLASEEADSVENHRHLAIAYKPQRDDARGIAFSKLDAGELQTVPGPLTWVVSKNKYFLLGLLTPVRDSAGAFSELRAVGGPRTTKEATNATAVAVETLRDGAFNFEMYTGPQEWRRLLAVGRDFENANPYGGWFQNVVQPFATIVMQVLLWMHESFKLSYGWVLVVFGIVIRIALWPLNQRAMRAQIKMQRIQPQLQAVQERHKGDPQKAQQEMMKVYAEHGMSPLSTVSGCLPVLLPWPILATLFFVFQNTIEFRGVPFLWLPDISLKDPYYILPLLMAASMFLLSWIGMRNMPPNPQAKLMAYAMPVMFIFIFLNFAAGLNLYYTVQNIAALPQQWLIANERAKVSASNPPAASPPPAKVAARERPEKPTKSTKSRRA
jgi:YidC/Oxa1 family membrane protein insertase